MPQRKTASGNEEMSGENEQRGDDHDALGPDEQDALGSDEQDWGFSSGRARISKETVVGLTLIVALMGAFGYVAYRKLKPEQTAAQTEETTPAAGENAENGTDENDASGVAGTLVSENQQAPVQTPDETAENETNDPWELSASSDRADSAGSETSESWDDKNSFGQPTASQTSTGQDDRERSDTMLNNFDFANTTSPTSRPSGAFSEDTGLGDAMGSAEPFDSGSMETEQDPFASRPGADSPSQPTFQEESVGTGSSGLADSQTTPEDWPTGALTGTQEQMAAEAAMQVNKPTVGGAATDGDILSERAFTSDFSAETALDSEDSANGTVSDSEQDEDRLGAYRAVEVEQEHAGSNTEVRFPHPESVTMPESDPDFGQFASSQNRDGDVDPGLNTSWNDPKSPTIDESVLEDVGTHSSTAESDAAEDLFNDTTSPQITADSGSEDPFQQRIFDQSADIRTDSGADLGKALDDSAGQGEIGASRSLFEPVVQHPKRQKTPKDSLPTPTGAATEYVVQANDSYWAISKKCYGSARYFQALVRHNKKQISDPRRMRPGTKISIPSRETLEAAYPDLLPERRTAAGPKARRSAQGRATDDSQPSGFFIGLDGIPMYRVGAEDTLTTISQDHLGRSSRWIQVYGMNRDQLNNPDSLTVGMQLRLPADASRKRLAGQPHDIR